MYLFLVHNSEGNLANGTLSNNSLEPQSKTEQLTKETLLNHLNYHSLRQFIYQGSVKRIFHF